MAVIVNLRLARKAKRRAEADGAAAVNRARFGTGKAERAALEAESARVASVLDGAKLD